MFMVVMMLGAILGTLRLSLYGIRFQDMLTARYPTLMEIIDFLDPFTSLLAYFGLTILFLLMYKILPNHHYTFRSQLPGALVVSTIWIFVSYLISIYYGQNANFLTTYGSLTGIVLAMIWLYFCVFFMLAGAELNRIFYEDPMNNVIASSIDTYMERRAEKEKIIEEADELYEQKAAEAPEEVDFHEIERVVLLRAIDQHWMEEIDDMEQLRQSIGLQAYGQKNPIDEYKAESYEMMDAMNEAIRHDTVMMMFRIRFERKIEREEVAKPTGTNKDDGPSQSGPKRRKAPKIYPNDPCPCGSGLKYKNCHGKKLYSSKG